ncbi:hypothetical protein AAFF_G00212080 [Aldrovandia affinis]|uniref:Lysosome-associated membrane glycoprotein 5 n=1 Tax=Aldrovandia affinis TaxID=143900 RepID=A0AAD7RGY9_9TELE|nr:hypothetical protein AAFF_G00212080 [Aldrovandia affinis]
MPRSETFPRVQRHAQIGSKPSIDSISAIKCEFDFQLKTANTRMRAGCGLTYTCAVAAFAMWQSDVMMKLIGCRTLDSARLQRLAFVFFSILSRILAEQEVENLSGLSPNPDKDIFVVRENGTTCLMAEFAVRFLVPYDVLALNGIDLITEQASIALPRGAEIEGKCGNAEAEVQISWINDAYVFRLFFVKEVHDSSKGNDIWKISKVQLLYDTSEKTHFINAYNPGKHTASSHRLSALVTPAGQSYECQAPQTLTLISTDHQKGVTVSLSDIQIQPFDITSDFTFSPAYKCITDQREQLEELLPLILGIVLGLLIVITLSVYHLHLKMTAHQPQLPRDRSLYKNILQF